MQEGGETAQRKISASSSSDIKSISIIKIFTASLRVIVENNTTDNITQNTVISNTRSSKGGKQWPLQPQN